MVSSKACSIAFSYKDFKGFHAADVPMWALRGFLDTLEDSTRPCNCLRVDQTGSRFSYRCRLAEPDVPLFMKKILPKSEFHRLVVEPLFGNAAAAGAANAIKLQSAGIATPRVFLVFDRYSDGRRIESYIVTRQADPFVFIEAFIHGGLDGESAGPAARAERIALWADLVRRLHDNGCYHLDLSNYNVMVRAGEGSIEFELVDLDMLTTVKNPDSLAGRILSAIELVIMNAMFKDRDFRKIDKLRFLKRYWGGELFRKRMRSPLVRMLFQLGGIGASPFFRRPAFAFCKMFSLVGAKTTV